MSEIVKLRKNRFGKLGVVVDALGSWQTGFKWSHDGWFRSDKVSMFVTEKHYRVEHDRNFIVSIVSNGCDSNQGQYRLNQINMSLDSLRKLRDGLNIVLDDDYEIK